MELVLLRGSHCWPTFRVWEWALEWDWSVMSWLPETRRSLREMVERTEVRRREKGVRGRRFAAAAACLGDGVLSFKVVTGGCERRGFGCWLFSSVTPPRAGV